MDLFCMERITVTSGCHGCKIFGSHRSIFTDTANSGRKVRPLCRFSWVQLCTGKSYMSIFSFLYSCHIVQDHGYLKSRIFATMATWRNDVSSLFRSSECCQWNEVDSWLCCTDNSYMKDHNSSSKSRWVGTKYWRVKFLQQPFTKIEKNNCFSIYILSALGNY